MTFRMFIFDGAHEHKCGGCSKTIPEGEPRLTGMLGCCGMDCFRALCRTCVEWAADALRDANDKTNVE